MRYVKVLVHLSALEMELCDGDCVVARAMLSGRYTNSDDAFAEMLAWIERGVLLSDTALQLTL
jgi:hypothetical protein